MITIAATEKVTHQQCKWLRPPRGLERGIIKVPANQHSLYSRASYIGTTQRCSITHNPFFCLWLIIWHGGRVFKKTGNIVSTQKTRGMHIRPGIASFNGFRTPYLHGCRRGKHKHH